MTKRPEIIIPERIGDAAEINYGAPADPDFGPLARDRIPVRAMVEADLPALIAIDQRITGRERSRYFEQKLHEALYESDVRISLVVEQDERPVGFIMARVDFGEFGRINSTAVMDTIGVDPDYQGHGIGRALFSQLLVNLHTLRVDTIRTEVDWRDRDLLAAVADYGFQPSQQLCFTRAI